MARCSASSVSGVGSPAFAAICRGLCAVAINISVISIYTAISMYSRKPQSSMSSRSRLRMEIGSADRVALAREGPFFLFLQYGYGLSVGSIGELVGSRSHCDRATSVGASFHFVFVLGEVLTSDTA